MVKSRRRIPSPTSICLFGIAFLLQGCATPIELKNASKTQLELIDSVDNAVADLQAALDQFHRDMEARILEEGRMLIARQAIDVATTKGASEVTADQLFEIYTKEIQPWVDYAFSLPSIEARIAKLEKRINAINDPILKVRLTMDLNDLKVFQADLQDKPQLVKELEVVIQDDLNNERETARKNHEVLEILRAQVALMKAMHQKVDAWLAIDVTVTQEQADALNEEWKEAFKDAHQARQALKGGGQ